jgi:hypothetical protein
MELLIRVTYQLPGIHLEPSLLEPKKGVYCNRRYYCRLSLLDPFYLNLYLKAYNSNFFNNLQPKTTTGLVVVAPTSVVAPPLSYPQLLF